MTRARGSLLAEMLLAAALLAFGLVPILGSFQSTAREARFLEYRSQALARARGLMQAARVHGPRAFEQALVGGSEGRLPIALPTASAGAPAPGEERVTVKVVRRAGTAALYLLTVRVVFVHPAAPERPVEITLVSLAGDPLASVNQGESP